MTIEKAQGYNRNNCKLVKGSSILFYAKFLVKKSVYNVYLSLTKGGTERALGRNIRQFH